MQTFQAKSLARHYSLEDYTGITKSIDKSFSALVYSRFIQPFKFSTSFQHCSVPILPYLWKKHRAGEEIDEEMIQEEFIRWIGRERFEEEMIKHPRDYEQFIQIIMDFFDAAEKEYYSGFSGFLRSLKEGKQTKRTNRYKKLL